MTFINQSPKSSVVWELFPFNLYMISCMISAMLFAINFIMNN